MYGYQGIILYSKLLSGEVWLSLCSCTILIEAKSPNILPGWCGFTTGLVDSEDLPLSILREKAQDIELVGKTRKALTRKIIMQLSKLMK